ncbi:Acyl-CoA N-acyltransferase [Cordyceps fumosorosea ARSEF 2679]|uniref:Acyl-CoA N-acyltransferase n=1 Tax=Cordyceps fumosorosea (strain ARSEF 2679) TaxID=1081104 RepID=A0A168D4H5_CORFA|nr:Acyl-CoA N-acyltransferase [Cordyceps fumosorosea ARSEF 2679]OAA72160.1 Acyl-CoA N-acyltransferase [Cordyceps fumosorosea ARSEF 2679]
MPLPSQGSVPQQKSIRSFFQPPKPPTYAPPPSSTTATPPRPSSPPLLPIPPPLTSATNPSLPRNATIRAVEPADVPSLRRLNSLLLPVAFPDSFYAAVLDPALSHRYSRVITWAGDGDGRPEEPKVVGAVVCIPEPSAANPAETNLYIRSLGVLAPYRALGLAGAALDDIVAQAAASALPLRSVTAHAWTENEQGLAWYHRRGFESCGAPIQGYYRRLRPDSAILVSRPVRAGAVLRAVNVQNGTSPADANMGSQPSATQPPPALKQEVAAATPPPSRPPTTSANLNSDARPPPPRGGSYQNQRPEMEWNDLPSDMTSLPPPPRRNFVGGSEPVSGAASGASSRSSSSAAQRKKRDRSYPAAAFGG